MAKASIDGMSPARLGWKCDEIQTRQKKSVKDLSENELAMIILRRLWMIYRKRKKITIEIKLLFASTNLIPMPDIEDIDRFTNQELLKEAGERIEKTQKQHDIPLPQDFHKFFET